MAICNLARFAPFLSSQLIIKMKLQNLYSTRYPKKNFEKKQQGFTLLEAIVALVLLSTVGLSLLSWLNSNLISLQRVQAAEQRSTVTRNALEFIDALNPMLQPQGQQTLGNYQLTWQAELVTDARDNIDSYYGTAGFYKVGLYAIHVEIYQQKQLITHFTVRQVGFEQVRKPSLGDF